jgi:hypothetical protein
MNHDQQGARTMVSPRKRKRKTAGPKLAPLVPMPMVPFLSDCEWQAFLDVLPSRSKSKILRDKVDELLVTYLGYLDGEARSPSTREVATVLQELARRAYQFAHDLLSLDLRLGNQEERFNTPNEVASRLLASVPLKPEGRSVLHNAMRANEVLARVAVDEAKKLSERSKKGRLTYGQATAWMLQRLLELLREHGLRVSARPKRGDPVCVLSKHFLRLALTRARALKGSEWASQEIKYALMLSDRVFMGRLRQAAEAVRESKLPL